MSLAGLRKQFNKANQFMSEKIGGAEGTKLDEEYIHCEKQIDIMSKLIEEIINKTHEFLQPNPATRAKLATLSTFNKIQGKDKTAPYPQPEGQLGDCMLKYGNELDHDSLFGESLIQAGNSFKNLEDVKYNMEDQVKREYIEPLRGIQSVELKEINFHRKKLEGRRLDFDCKKRRKENKCGFDAASFCNRFVDPQAAKVLEDEVKVAEDKFQESKVLAETAMANFLASDEINRIRRFIELVTLRQFDKRMGDMVVSTVYIRYHDKSLEQYEHISALAEFVDAQANYYRHATEIMENLHKVLLEKPLCVLYGAAVFKLLLPKMGSRGIDGVLIYRKDEAQSRGKQPHIPKPVQITGTLSSGDMNSKNGSMSSPRTPNKASAPGGHSNTFPLSPQPPNCLLQ
ncbi:hypothetical protein ACTXT7_014343 [Hymenolepis weldensis]